MRCSPSKLCATLSPTDGVNRCVKTRLNVDVIVTPDPRAASGYRAQGFIGDMFDQDILEEMRWKVWDRIAMWRGR